MSAKEQYWRYSLITIILVLGIILFIEFISFLGGILGASTIYILVRNQMLYLTEKKKIRPSMTAILLLIESILIFLIPLTLTVWLFISKLQNINLDPNAFVREVEHIVNLIENKTGYNIFDRDNISSIVSTLPQIGQTLMSGITGFVVNIFVLLFVLYFMIIGGKKMEKYIYEILPFSQENKKNVVKEIELIVKSNAIGIPLLAIIQGLVALIGYVIFGVPNALLFGFLTCFATIIPIVGTSIVWAPLVVYLALTGNWIFAICLAAYSLAIITNVDNLIRFVLQKKLADTHPLITIFGVVIGLSLFGFMGVIFGPLLLSIFILCVNIFKKEYLENNK